MPGAIDIVAFHEVVTADTLGNNPSDIPHDFLISGTAGNAFVVIRQSLLATISARECRDLLAPQPLHREEYGFARTPLSLC